MNVSFPRSAAATGVAAALLLAPAAGAHDAVIGGSPANGEVVATFPSTLELTFSGQPKDGFNTVALSRVGGGGADIVYTGEPDVRGQDVVLDLPGDFAAEPGEYQIGFQIVSSDGHATKGTTTFTYAPDGSATTETAAASAEDANSGEPSIADQGENSNRTLLLSIIGLVVIAGVAIAAVGKRRQARKLEERTILDPDPDTHNS
ncbi:copper resistance CopC family protein [Corynebacterium sp. Q4381]|uniref:copper resistance CopC family protein n=1 Tax=Corynebacterium sp. Marseille-Q4381 TaxID=3121597 RepID=UPI002FE5AF80